MINTYLTSILTFGFLVLGYIWIITLPKHYRTTPEKLLNPKVLTRIALIILTIPFTLGAAMVYRLPPTELDPMLEIIGIFLYIAGFVLAIWAKYTMKDMWGGPAQHDNKGQDTLITTGPFAFSRNPIYLALLLLFVGFARTIHSPAIVLVIPYFYVFTGFINAEEQLLQQHFGKNYVEYKKKVPRWIKISTKF